MSGRIQKDVSSAHRAVAVTPSDATILPAGVRGLWIGSSGDLSVVMVGDTAPVTLAGALAGTWLPVQVSKVMAATTADDIVAFY